MRVDRRGNEMDEVYGESEVEHEFRSRYEKNNKYNTVTD
jgi:CTP synthase (UTP-ammonia lyase)